MKRYLRQVPVLSSIDSNHIDDLSLKDMLSIKDQNTRDDGNYGPFESFKEFETFAAILYRLEDLGYEI